MLSPAKWISVFAIFLTAAVAVYLHFYLPEGPVATNFAADGTPDGFMSRDMAFGFTPVTLVLLTALMWALPKIMPKNASLERSMLAYDTIWVAVVCLLVAVDGLIIARAVGYEINMPLAVSVMIGALFIIMGNVLPKFRYNYVAGIRTPWTLSDERVWDRTHRFAGPAFMLGGVAIIISGFVTSPDYFAQALIVFSLLPSLVCVVVSFLHARGLKG